MGLYSLPQSTTVCLDDVAFLVQISFPSGQEAVFLCPRMVIALGVLVTIVCAMHHSGNSTMQVDRPPDDRTNQAAPTDEGAASSEDLTNSLEGEWVRAEERYGLARPAPAETVIAVHRQTSQRLALAPDTWEEIPVHCEMPPEAILSDIAHWYNDIRAKWEDATVVAMSGA